MVGTGGLPGDLCEDAGPLRAADGPACSAHCKDGGADLGADPHGRCVLRFPQGLHRVHAAPVDEPDDDAGTLGVPGDAGLSGGDRRPHLRRMDGAPNGSPDGGGIGAAEHSVQDGDVPHGARGDLQAGPCRGSDADERGEHDFKRRRDRHRGGRRRSIFRSRPTTSATRARRRQ